MRFTQRLLLGQKCRDGIQSGTSLSLHHSPPLRPRPARPEAPSTALLCPPEPLPASSPRGPACCRAASGPRASLEKVTPGGSLAPLGTQSPASGSVHAPILTTSPPALPPRSLPPPSLSTQETNCPLSPRWLRGVSNWAPRSPLQVGPPTAAAGWATAHTMALQKTALDPAAASPGFARRSCTRHFPGGREG